MVTGITYRFSFFSLILPVAILLSFGLLMIFETTSAEIIDRSLGIDTRSALWKQLFYCVIGLGLGAVAYRIGFEQWIASGRILLWGATFLLVLLFIPGIGQSIHGAKRWISLMGWSFQPSEWVKLCIPFAYIQWMKKREEPFLKMLGRLALPIALILLEPDNGTAAILLFLLSVLFLLSSIPFSYWALPLICLIAVAATVAWQMPHARKRIEIYLHPERDLLGKGHQPYQAKIAAGSGGLWGKGLGESLQKLSYLPEARNDYIAAIFAEEVGFVGVTALILIYMLFTYGGLTVAYRTKHLEGKTLAASLTSLIAIQAFLNLGVVSGLLPSKGMTLPFFSQGGTSLIVNLVILFLLLDISRKSLSANKERE
ncbi:MAG: cell division protein FtsW [Verrucomicrobiota bacterium]|nr:cell division protein FtsW [Verrucomicrobiota bacterium]